MPRPVLIKGQTQTLAFAVPESSLGHDPSAATVSVFDENGAATTIAGASATVAVATAYAPAQLSVSVASTILDAVGDNFRAAWSYTVDGASYLRQQTFECRTHALYQTLTAAALFGSYWPILKNRLPAGMTERRALDAGWSRVLDEVHATGKSPHLIMDPAPLEPAHAHFTAAVIAKSLALGSASGGGDEQQWADAREADAKQALKLALANVAWIDANEDSVASADETNTSGFTLTFSR